MINSIVMVIQKMEMQAMHEQQNNLGEEKESKGILAVIVFLLIWFAILYYLVEFVTFK